MNVTPLYYNVPGTIAPRPVNGGGAVSVRGDAFYLAISDCVVTGAVVDPRGIACVATDFDMQVFVRRMCHVTFENAIVAGRGGF
jgi:hypothetical protein